MKPLPVWISLAIIIVSLGLLYISRNVFINQFKSSEYKADFSIITTNEDIELSKNPN